MKIAIKIILLVGVVGYLIFAVARMSRDDDKRVCRGIRIYLEQTGDQDLVDSQFVAGLLSPAEMPLQGRLVRDIDLKGIESSIQASPYIDSVICYYTPEELMCIRVIPRHPILHVMADNGENYYMDARGNDMPAGPFCLDLSLATGNITKQYARENLLDIAAYLNTHSPWNRDIQQIYVRGPRHIELIPTVEGQTIVLGEPTGIEDKMRRLSAFYEECLNKVGWNKYSIINLNYADQVVCTRKKHKK